jgi:hypothetical protein
MLLFPRRKSGRFLPRRENPSGLSGMRYAYSTMTEMPHVTGLPTATGRSKSFPSPNPEFRHAGGSARAAVRLLMPPMACPRRFQAERDIPRNLGDAGGQRLAPCDPIARFVVVSRRSRSGARRCETTLPCDLKWPNVSNPFSAKIRYFVFS